MRRLDKRTNDFPIDQTKSTFDQILSSKSKTQHITDLIFDLLKFRWLFFVEFQSLLLKSRLGNELEFISTKTKTFFGFLKAEITCYTRLDAKEENLAFKVLSNP